MYMYNLSVLDECWVNYGLNCNKRFIIIFFQIVYLIKRYIVRSIIFRPAIIPLSQALKPSPALPQSVSNLEGIAFFVTMFNIKCLDSPQSMTNILYIYSQSIFCCENYVTIDVLLILAIRNQKTVTLNRENGYSSACVIVQNKII